MIKWQTKSGKILKISEMTDIHLTNSIKYLEKGNGNKNDLDYLYAEKRKRETEKWDNETSICPHCHSKSKRVKFEDPELTFAQPEYRFVCQNVECGATGPKHFRK